MTASFGTTEDIIQILENLQPFLRKPIMKNKMGDFFKTDKELQLETINLILGSLENVKLEEYSDLITTWLETLSEFDNIKINFLIQLYLENIGKNQILISKLESIIMDSLKNLDEIKKNKLRNCFLETLFCIKNDKNILLSSLKKETLNWLLNTSC